MRNWASKTGYFHACPTLFGETTTNQIDLGGNGYTKIAPGQGGRLRYDMTFPAAGDFEGNPDKFPRLTWLNAPNVSDPHWSGDFRYSAYEDSGIRSARVLQGKTVTLSMQFRCPSTAPQDVGISVALQVYRANCGVPVQCRTPPLTDQDIQIWLDSPRPIYGGATRTRVDFTFLLPQCVGFVPDSNPALGESILGIGFMIVGQYVQGGVLDVGPYQFNEGLPQPIEECPR